MSTSRAFSIRAMIRVALPCLVVFLCLLPAATQSNNADYIFLLASGFLCDPGDSSTCPAVVKSASGDSYEMSGAGRLNTQSRSVTATGTFTHKSALGDVLETGVWIAGELVSFNSYGIAPGALMRERGVVDPQQFALKRLPMSSGAMPEGGLAVFRIRFLPMRGVPKTAVLQVNCALGNVPHERSVEGIRLSLGKDGTEFSLEVSGRVMFLLMPPEATTPVNTPQRKAAPASPATPSN